MKVSDAINECIFYPYSRDHYELTEMCYRISLMEQFVENQRFISSIHDRTSAVMYESGAFGERVDEDIIERVITEAGEDKVTVWNRIQMGAHKMVQWIKDMFFKIAVRFDKSIKQAKEINQELDKKKIGKDLYNKLNKVCLDAQDENKESGDIFIPYKEQPFKANLHFLNDVSSEDQSRLMSYVSAALSDTKVKARADSHTEGVDENGEKKKYVVGMVPPIELVNKLYDFVKGDNITIDHLNSELDQIGEKTAKEGLEIEVNPAAVKDMADRLSKISSQMETIQAKTKSRGSTSSDDDKKDESQTESYWYDFYPEYLYEGCYDDWDPIYGDPLSEAPMNTVAQVIAQQPSKISPKQAKKNGQTPAPAKTPKAPKPKRVDQRQQQQQQSQANQANDLQRRISDLRKQASELGNRINHFRDNQKKGVISDSTLVANITTENDDVKYKLTELKKEKKLTADQKNTLNGIEKYIERMIVDGSESEKATFRRMIKPTNEFLQIADKDNNFKPKSGVGEEDYNKKLEAAQKVIKEVKKALNPRGNGPISTEMLRVCKDNIYNSILGINPISSNSGSSSRSSQSKSSQSSGNSDIINQDQRNAIKGIVSLLSEDEWKEMIPVIVTGVSKKANGGNWFTRIVSKRKRQIHSEEVSHRDTLSRYKDLLEKINKKDDKGNTVTFKSLSDDEKRDVRNAAKTLEEWEKKKNKYESIMNGTKPSDATNDTSSGTTDTASPNDDHQGDETGSTDQNNNDQGSDQGGTPFPKEDVQNLNKSYAFLKKHIGQVMHVYLGYTHYREKVISGLNDVLSLGENSSNDSNDNENEEEEAS